MNPPYHTRPPRENKRVGISGKSHIPQLRPDDAADDSGGNHVGGVIVLQTGLPKLSGYQPAAHEEGDHQHDAVARDLEWSEVNDERVDRHDLDPDE